MYSIFYPCSLVLLIRIVRRFDFLIFFFGLFHICLYVSLLPPLLFVIYNNLTDEFGITMLYLWLSDFHTAFWYAIFSYNAYTVSFYLLCFPENKNIYVSGMLITVFYLRSNPNTHHCSLSCYFLQFIFVYPLNRIFLLSICPSLFSHIRKLRVDNLCPLMLLTSVVPS